MVREYRDYLNGARANLPVLQLPFLLSATLSLSDTVQPLPALHRVTMMIARGLTLNHLLWASAGALGYVANAISGLPADPGRVNAGGGEGELQQQQQQRLLGRLLELAPEGKAAGRLLINASALVLFVVFTELDWAGNGGLTLRQLWGSGKLLSEVLVALRCGLLITTAVLVAVTCSCHWWETVAVFAFAWLVLELASALLTGHCVAYALWDLDGTQLQHLFGAAGAVVTLGRTGAATASASSAATAAGALGAGKASNYIIPDGADTADDNTSTSSRGLIGLLTSFLRYFQPLHRRGDTYSADGYAPMSADGHNSASSGSSGAKGRFDYDYSDGATFSHNRHSSSAYPTYDDDCSDIPSEIAALERSLSSAVVGGSGQRQQQPYYTQLLCRSASRAASVITRRSQSLSAAFDRAVSSLATASSSGRGWRRLAAPGDETYIAAESASDPDSSYSSDLPYAVDGAARAPPRYRSALASLGSAGGGSLSYRKAVGSRSLTAMLTLLAAAMAHAAGTAPGAGISAAAAAAAVSSSFTFTSVGAAAAAAGSSLSSSKVPQPGKGGRYASASAPVSAANKGKRAGASLSPSVVPVPTTKLTSDRRHDATTSAATTAGDAGYESYEADGADERVVFSRSDLIRLVDAAAEVAKRVAPALYASSSSSAAAGGAGSGSGSSSDEDAEMLGLFSDWDFQDPDPSEYAYPSSDSSGGSDGDEADGRSGEGTVGSFLFGRRQGREEAMKALPPALASSLTQLDKLRSDLLSALVDVDYGADEEVDHHMALSEAMMRPGSSSSSSAAGSSKGSGKGGKGGAKASPRTGKPKETAAKEAAALRAFRATLVSLLTAWSDDIGTMTAAAAAAANGLHPSDLAPQYAPSAIELNKDATVGDILGEAPAARPLQTYPADMAWAFDESSDFASSLSILAEYVMSHVVAEEESIKRRDAATAAAAAAAEGSEPDVVEEPLAPTQPDSGFFGLLTSWLGSSSSSADDNDDVDSAGSGRQAAPSKIVRMRDLPIPPASLFDEHGSSAAAAAAAFRDGSGSAGEALKDDLFSAAARVSSASGSADAGGARGKPNTVNSIEPDPEFDLSSAAAAGASASSARGHATASDTAKGGGSSSDGGGWAMLSSVRSLISHVTAQASSLLFSGREETPAPTAAAPTIKAASADVGGSSKQAKAAKAPAEPSASTAQKKDRTLTADTVEADEGIPASETAATGFGMLAWAQTGLTYVLNLLPAPVKAVLSGSVPILIKIAEGWLFLYVLLWMLGQALGGGSGKAAAAAASTAAAASAKRVTTQPGSGPAAAKGGKPGSRRSSLAASAPSSSTASTASSAAPAAAASTAAAPAGVAVIRSHAGPVDEAALLAELDALGTPSLLGNNASTSARAAVSGVTGSSKTGAAGKGSASSSSSSSVLSPSAAAASAPSSSASGAKPVASSSASKPPASNVRLSAADGLPLHVKAQAAKTSASAASAPTSSSSAAAPASLASAAAPSGSGAAKTTVTPLRKPAAIAGSSGSGTSRGVRGLTSGSRDALETGDDLEAAGSVASTPKITASAAAALTPSDAATVSVSGATDDVTAGSVGSGKGKQGSKSASKATTGAAKTSSVATASSGSASKAGKGQTAPAPAPASASAASAAVSSTKRPGPPFTSAAAGAEPAAAQAATKSDVPSAPALSSTSGKQPLQLTSLIGGALAAVLPSSALATGTNAAAPAEAATANASTAAAPSAVASPTKLTLKKKGSGKGASSLLLLTPTQPQPAPAAATASASSTATTSSAAGGGGGMLASVLSLVKGVGGAAAPAPPSADAVAAAAAAADAVLAAAAAAGAGPSAPAPIDTSDLGASAAADDDGASTPKASGGNGADVSAGGALDDGMEVVGKTKRKRARKKGGNGGGGGAGGAGGTDAVLFPLPMLAQAAAAAAGSSKPGGGGSGNGGKVAVLPAAGALAGTSSSSSSSESPQSGDLAGPASVSGLGPLIPTPQLSAIDCGLLDPVALQQLLLAQHQQQQRLMMAAAAAAGQSPDGFQYAGPGGAVSSGAATYLALQQPPLPPGSRYPSSQQQGQAGSASSGSGASQRPPRDIYGFVAGALGWSNEGSNGSAASSGTGKGRSRTASGVTGVDAGMGSPQGRYQNSGGGGLDQLNPSQQQPYTDVQQLYAAALAAFGPQLQQLQLEAAAAAAAAASGSAESGASASAGGASAAGSASSSDSAADPAAALRLQQQVTAALAARRLSLILDLTRLLAEKRYTDITTELDSAARGGDRQALITLTMIAQGVDVPLALTYSGLLPAAVTGVAAAVAASSSGSGSAGGVSDGLVSPGASAGHPSSDGRQLGYSGSDVSGGSGSGEVIISQSAFPPLPTSPGQMLVQRSGSNGLGSPPGGQQQLLRYPGSAAGSAFPSRPPQATTPLSVSDEAAFPQLGRPPAKQQRQQQGGKQQAQGRRSFTGSGSNNGVRTSFSGGSGGGRGRGDTDGSLGFLGSEFGGPDDVSAPSNNGSGRLSIAPINTSDDQGEDLLLRAGSGGGAGGAAAGAYVRRPSDVTASSPIAELLAGSSDVSGAGASPSIDGTGSRSMAVGRLSRNASNASGGGGGRPMAVGRRNSGSRRYGSSGNLVAAAAEYQPTGSFGQYEPQPQQQMHQRQQEDEAAANTAASAAAHGLLTSLGQLGLLNGLGGLTSPDSIASNSAISPTAGGGAGMLAMSGSVYDALAAQLQQLQSMQQQGLQSPMPDGEDSSSAYPSPRHPQQQHQQPRQSFTLSGRVHVPASMAATMGMPGDNSGSAGAGGNTMTSAGGSAASTFSPPSSSSAPPAAAPSATTTVASSAGLLDGLSSFGSGFLSGGFSSLTSGLGLGSLFGAGPAATGTTAAASAGAGASSSSSNVAAIGATAPGTARDRGASSSLSAAASVSASPELAGLASMDPLAAPFVFGSSFGSPPPRHHAGSNQHQHHLTSGGQYSGGSDVGSSARASPASGGGGDNHDVSAYSTPRRSGGHSLVYESPLSSSRGLPSPADYHNHSQNQQSAAAATGVGFGSNTGGLGLSLLPGSKGSGAAQLLHNNHHIHATGGGGGAADSDVSAGTPFSFDLTSRGGGGGGGGSMAYSSSGFNLNLSRILKGALDTSASSSSLMDAAAASAAATGSPAGSSGPLAFASSSSAAAAAAAAAVHRSISAFPVGLPTSPDGSGNDEGGSDVSGRNSALFRSQPVEFGGHQVIGSASRHSSPNQQQQQYQHLLRRLPVPLPASSPADASAGSTGSAASGSLILPGSGISGLTDSDIILGTSGGGGSGSGGGVGSSGGMRSSLALASPLLLPASFHVGGHNDGGSSGSARQSEGDSIDLVPSLQ